MPDLESVNYTLALLGIAAILVGWARGWWESPKRRTEREQNQEIHEAILGEPERRDRSGHLSQEGRPGLVALQRADSERLGKVEEAVIEFRHVIGIYTEVLQRMDRAESDIAALKDTNVKDIMLIAERAATAAASAEMLRLANERDTIHGDSTESAGEL